MVEDAPMNETLVLLTSPLVGPSTWEPTQDALLGRGTHAVAIDLRDAVTPNGADLVSVARAVAAAPSGPPILLVPHSGAGPLTPWLAAHVPGVVGTIFIDAGLPPAGVTGVPLAPPSFQEHLRSLADDAGMLPPWAGWWSDEAMAELVPEPDTRARLVAEMRPLPLSYFRSEVPVPPGWPAVPGAYLGFGGRAYADDLARARSFGWPVEVLPHAGHLHPAVAPKEVADALLSLAGTMTP
jgi:hypothetical protein